MYHNMTHTLKFVLVLGMLCVLSLSQPAAAQEGGAGGEIIPGEVIVRFAPQSDEQVSLASVNALSADVDPISGLVNVAVTPGQEADVIAQLEAQGEVVYATFNYRVQAFETPDDPFIGSQWAFTDDDSFGIGLPAGWDIETGDGEIIIAVIDSGADLDHPDLVDNLMSGYNFLTDGATPPDDDNSHGSHVSGVAAARANNGIGIAGVSWNARIMPLKMLDNSGNGDTEDIARAIYYAVDNGAKIINMSLGSASSSAPCGWDDVEEAITYAAENGVLMFAASGNRGRRGVTCPAAYEQVIAVGASDTTGDRASLSNWGPNLDLIAPGVNIYSTMPGGSYSTKSGTSMATPHVAGAAALIWSFKPDLTAAEVETMLLDSATDLQYEGWDNFTGHGRLNVQKALASLALNLTPPSVVLGNAPVTLSVTTTDPDLAVVAWTAVISPSVGWATVITPTVESNSTAADTGAIVIEPNEPLQAADPTQTNLVVTGMLSTGTEVGPVMAIIIAAGDYETYLPVVIAE